MAPFKAAVCTLRFHSRWNLIALLLPVSLAFFVTASVGQERTSRLDQVTVEQWRDDLSVLAQQMQARHANLYHTVSPSRFDLSIRNLKRRVPALSPLKIVLEIESIVASVRDGHTRVMDNRIPFRRYPLRFKWYKDGVFVQSAQKNYADAVGARVTRIGKLSIDEAISAVADIVPRDNDFSLRERVPWRLVTPEILFGLGLVDNMEHAQYELERNGRRWSIEVAPLQQPPMECQGVLRQLPSDWSDARQPGTPPLWLRNPCESYWFEYIPDTQMLYVQVNEVQNRGNATLAQFFERVFAVAESRPLARFVLDLRLNAGGNLDLLRPIMVGLIRRENINQRGKFFTIIGRRTFSAAQYWVDELEKYTETVFVGEPTAQAVNFYSDAEVFQLPHSGIRIGVSSLRWQPMPPWQDRLSTDPQIGAELASFDYTNNLDPAIDAILRYGSAKR
ncbi:MAG TPA: hypothetical protein VGQ39_26270 [Pyrinomonadaceae bacterium]|nr:hypothetical protein [Pyrinomonadaceae bacterium]